MVMETTSTILGRFLETGGYHMELYNNYDTEAEDRVYLHQLIISECRFWSVR